MNVVSVLAPILEAVVANTGSLDVSLSCFCALPSKTYFFMACTGAEGCLSMVINLKLALCLLRGESVLSLGLWEFVWPWRYEGSVS